MRARPSIKFRNRALVVSGLLALSWGCAPRPLPPESAQPDTLVYVPAAVVPPPQPGPSIRTENIKEAPVETTQGKTAQTSAAFTPTAPLFFEGREKVTYGEFISELRNIADGLVRDPDVVTAHQDLLTLKNLTEEELPLQSFSRVRLAFESARDSGLWGIRGTITDQMPWSDRIWDQWSGRSFSAESPLPTSAGAAFPTAVGECDEMGALFAILARDLGVTGFVGLHWPYWNHVVPVWQVDRKDGKFERIVVPATQTFLESAATIGTTGLPTRRVVFPYMRKDRRDDTEISADLARFLLTQSYLYGGQSTQELTQRRLWHRSHHRPDPGASTVSQK